eukprot:501063-Amphidinium_carterae.1
MPPSSFYFCSFAVCFESHPDHPCHTCDHGSRTTTFLSFKSAAHTRAREGGNQQLWITGKNSSQHIVPVSG